MIDVPRVVSAAASLRVFGNSANSSRSIRLRFAVDITARSSSRVNHVFLSSREHADDKHEGDNESGDHGSDYNQTDVRLAGRPSSRVRLVITLFDTHARLSADHGLLRHFDKPRLKCSAESRGTFSPFRRDSHRCLKRSGASGRFAPHSPALPRGLRHSRRKLNCLGTPAVEGSSRRLS